MPLAGLRIRHRLKGQTMAGTWNHFDQEGNAVMVDVSEKKTTARTASAVGSIQVNREIMEAVVHKTAAKGDVLGVARVAGIMATKRTPDLIPMCHPLMLNKASIDFQVDPERNTITAECTVKLTGLTGVEMEALTGVSVALLTVYDMCKAIDKTMTIGDIHLVRKEGGKSGVFVNERD